MPTYAKLRTDAVVLNPVAPAAVPENNALFVNSANANIFTNKDNSGTTVEVVSAEASALKKQMQSGFAGVIPALTPIAKLPSGKIVPADTDEVSSQTFVGITLESFAALNSLGIVQLVGPNVPAVLTSLGFAPGDEIFLGETGGYTNNPDSFTGNNDSIIRIGIADCTAGAASVTADDLILFTEVIARP